MWCLVYCMTWCLVCIFVRKEPRIRFALFVTFCIWVFYSRLWLISSLIYLRPSQGFFRNRGIRPFISGEQENKSLKLKGTGDQSVLGSREHRKSRFDFGEQGEMPIFVSGEQGNRYPLPLGRATYLA